MLTYKCVLAGKVLIQIDERDTSKTCSRCGHQQPMPLWKRTYRCGNCGLVLDRDDNSAVNLLQRSLARLGPHASQEARCIAGEPGGVAVRVAAQVAHVQESTRVNTF